MKRIPKNLTQCKYCKWCCTIIMHNSKNKRGTKQCYIGIDSVCSVDNFPYNASKCSYFEVSDKYIKTDLSKACYEINNFRRLTEKVNRKCSGCRFYIDDKNSPPVCSEWNRNGKNNIDKDSNICYLYEE